MKKIGGILLLCGIVQIASSQVVIALLFGEKLNSGKLEFGLAVSPALTNISGSNSKYKTGFNLGLYFNIKISDNFFLHPEAGAKVSFGAKDMVPYSTGNDTLDALYANGSIERKIKAFSLPLLCNYRIYGPLFAEAGVQADLMLKSRDIYHTVASDNELDYTTKINDQVTRFDLCAVAGFICKFRKDSGLGLGIRYLYGLTDIIKTMPGIQANRVWLLNITIPVGAGKASADKKKK